jgi:hypothetical protein
MLALRANQQAPRRGVYKVRGTFLGRNAYYAFTSHGALLNDCIYVVSETQSDAAIADWLFEALDAADPRHARQLRIIERTVRAAVDGPSGHHPMIREEMQRDSAARERSIVPVGVSWVLILTTPSPSSSDPYGLSA